MANDSVSFKESRIVKTTTLLLFVGFISTFVPEENWALLLVTTGLAIVCSILFIVIWMKTRHNSKRYFSLLSYVMLNGLSIFFAIPLFRVFAGSFVFWGALILIILMIGIPHMFNEKIGTSVQNPAQSPLGKMYILFLLLLFGFGTTLFFNYNLTQNPDALTISIILFIVTLSLLFISPVLLIKPERMKELEK